MSKRSTFRPTVQVLETRKLMAGDAFGVTGVDDPTVDGDQTTAVTVTGSTISGNTANAAWPPVKLPVFQCPSDPASASDNDATDAFFAELGDDDTGDETRYEKPVEEITLKYERIRWTY